MAINLNNLIKINPGVLPAGASAVDLNGLVLTQSAIFPVGQVLKFGDAASVLAYVGDATSSEYLGAVNYFKGPDNATKTPTALYFAYYPAANVGAWIRGAKLSLTLTQLQALSGSITVTIDGTVKTAASVSLSAATSFANAASLIQTALSLSGSQVTWNATLSAFVISSATTGATSTITAATGTLATSLLLTSATGVTISQGAVAAVPGTFMESVMGIQQNWALFATAWEPVTADKVAFSTWTNGKNNRYGYVGWDTDINATVANSTTTWLYTINQSTMSGSVPVYGLFLHAIFVLSFAACLDFSRLNGRQTLAWRTQSGLTPYVTDNSLYSGLDTNGYNFYGQYADSGSATFNIMQPGKVTGSFAWLDTYLDQIKLNSSIQLALVNLLMAVGNIPYNADGYSTVDTTLLDPISAAVNFGTIRNGVVLTNVQKLAVKQALGYDASQTIFAKGWVSQVADPGATVRASRGSPVITLYYTDGQSIHKITMASIVIM